MFIGIDLDGNKDVLGMWIGENEYSKFWLSVLNDLRNRGVQDILITCVDNLTGLLLGYFRLLSTYGNPEVHHPPDEIRLVTSRTRT